MSPARLAILSSWAAAQKMGVYNNASIAGGLLAACGDVTAAIARADAIDMQCERVKAYLRRVAAEESEATSNVVTNENPREAAWRT